MQGYHHRAVYIYLVFGLAFALVSSGCGRTIEGTNESGSSILPGEGGWTGWHSYDRGSGSGDHEQRAVHEDQGWVQIRPLDQVEAGQEWQLCPYPTNIQCRVKNGPKKHTPAASTGQKFVSGHECTIEGGLICKNSMNNRQCYDYEVRYFCPKTVPSGPEPVYVPEPEPNKISVGTLGGAISVKGGQASYQVKLRVPPGTRGYAPSLSLGYQSGGADGILGKGWQLIGPSVISRVAATKKHDGFIDAVDFDDNDRFELDGQRLVKVGSKTNGAGKETEAFYRTLLESGVRVRAKLDKNQQPLRFTVETRDRTTRTYGQSSRSRIGNETGTLAWFMEKSQDMYGNYIAYEFEDGLLRSIDYTGNKSAKLAPYNKIELLYESRPDVHLYYAAGIAARRLDRRLKKVVMLVKNETGGPPDHHVREYRIGYKQSVLTGISQLTSIQEVSGLNEGETSIALPPTKFEWRNGSRKGLKFDQQVSIRAPSQDKTNIVAQGDFDGDGLSDFMLGAVDPSGRFTSPDKKPTVYLSSRGFSGEPTNLPPHTPPPAFHKKKIVASADFDGDGLTDLITAFVDTTSDWRIKPVPRMHFSLGDGTFSDVPIKMDKCHDVVRGVGDFNGDGVADLLLQNCILFTQPGTKQSARTFVTKKHDFLGNKRGEPWRVYVGELNGDGLADVVTESLENSVCSSKKAVSKAYLNMGNGTFEERGTAGGGYGWRIVGFSDFNGDGLADRLYGASTSSDWCTEKAKFSRFQLVPSKGDGHAATWSSTTKIFSGARQVFGAGDYDGDGRTDFRFGRTAFRFDGRNFVSRPAPPIPNSKVIKVVGDTNSDGLPDYILGGEGEDGLIPADSELTHFTAQIQSPDEITKVVNGLGSITKIEYKNMTSPGLYERGHGATYPKRDFYSPLVVVSRVWTDSGLGTPTSANAHNATEYQYGKALVDVSQGRFMGYEYVRTIDPQRQTAVTESFEQGFPCIGVPKEKETRLFYGMPEEQVVRRVVHTPKYVVGFGEMDGAGTPIATRACSDTAPTPGETYVPFVASSTEERWEIGAVDPWDRKTQTTQIDRFGNVVFQAAGFAGGGEDTVTKEYEYFENQQTWIPGRVLSETKTSLHRNEQVERTTHFAYNRGRLQFETKDKGTPHELQARYYYDIFGNIKRKDMNGKKEASYRFDSNGQFPVCTVNALGHVEVREYSKSLGLETKVVDANAVALSGNVGCPEALPDDVPSLEIQYDALGRKTKELLPSLSVNQRAQKTYEIFPSDGKPVKYWTAVKGTGTAQTVVRFDRLGRQIGSASEQQNPTTSGTNTKKWNLSLTQYDRLGRVRRTSDSHVSDPDGNASQQPIWHTSKYDALDRVTESVAFDGTVSKHEYDGRFETVIRDAQEGGKSIKETRVFDARGRVVQVIDDAGSTLALRYDAGGHLVRSTIQGDGKTVVTRMEYDAVGNRTAIIDRNLGHWTYEYNAFKQLTRQTDSTGRETTMKYDALGRMTLRNSPEGTETWAYDRLGDRVAIGKVMKEQGTANGGTRPVRIHGYDGLGRLKKTEAEIKGNRASTHHDYDTAGRITRRSYAAEDEILYHIDYKYDAKGFLRGAYGSDGKNWFSGAQYDSNGALTEFLDGTGAKTTRTHNRKTQALTKIETFRNDNTILKLGLRYDAVGNITRRTDHALHVAEVFEYDRLNRLTSATGTGQNGPWMEIQYDALGNIENRRESYWTPSEGRVIEERVFTPSGNRPNAVGTVGNTRYRYDANGNMTFRGNTNIDWSSFNKPLWFGTADPRGATTTIDSVFEYDTDRKRIFQRTIEQWTGTTRYEDSEDQTTRGWSVYDGNPAGAQIKNVEDEAKGDRVIEVSGSGLENGYRLRRFDHTPWENTNQSIFSWDQKFSEPFSIFVEIETNAGPRYLRYTPSDLSNLGQGKYIHHGLGEDHADGQWRTVVRDLEADLKGGQPDLDLIKVNSFLVRGSGRVDNIGAPLSETQVGRTVKEKRYWFQDFEQTNVYEEICHETQGCRSNWTRGAYVLHIAGPAGPLGSIAITGPHAGQRAYYYTDHLGSIVARADAKGVITEHYSYDAWGRRRDPTTGTPLAKLKSKPNWFQYGFSDRGYTGHETLDALGLIHMNGRIYDPAIGRFLSPDPFVRNAFNLQAHNRYTYVNNNPLVNIDPSGFFLRKLLRKAVRLLERYMPVILSAVVGALTMGFALALAPAVWSGLTAATFSGLVSGFSSSFVGALASGQGFNAALKAGIRGGLTGAVTAGLKAAILTEIHTHFTAADKSKAELYKVTMRKGVPSIKRVDVSEIRGRGIKLWVNGQSNMPAKAANLGFERVRADEFYMIHNPTNGGFMDTIESALGKATGRTPISQSTANILSQVDLSKSHLYAHSQGGIITRNALVMRHQMGQNLSGLKVTMDGAAVNWGTTHLIFKTMGVELPFRSFTAHPWDFVPNLIGGNALFPVPNPYRVAGSVLFSPGVFLGGPGSAHTNKGGGAWVQGAPHAY